MMGISNDITPEKVTQVIGNYYKETLSQIKFENFPNEVRLVLFMTISFYVYCDNILLNVGVKGLSEFIKQSLLRFRYSDLPDPTKVMNEYIKEWRKFADDIVEKYKHCLVSPKLGQLMENFLTEDKWESDDQMIIFVDQRIIADLLLKTLQEECDMFQSNKHVNMHLIDAVYSHSNKGIFKKIIKKTKVESEKIVEIFEEILSFENAQGRSLDTQKKTLKHFKSKQCKVLIATNVIEEGLDIPSCNKIIIYDKIQTPKTFIQMSGRARKAESSISFMCLDTELEEIKSNVQAMQNYKELLAANESLAKIKPDVRPKTCTYTNEEIFVIEDTGARVSIDGSLDLLNMIRQKLASKIKVGKLTEKFEEERGATMNFKCILSIKVGKNVISKGDDKFFTTKAKAKAYSALKVIEELHSLGFLDDHLNAQTEVYKRQKQEEGKRQKVVKKLTKFKEESKEKHNKETVEGVEFTYHIDHDKLISFEKYEKRAKIIVLEPESENTYPFLSTKLKR